MATGILPFTVSQNPNQIKANPSQENNDRIKKIAIDVLKGVAAVVVGALFTAMTMSPFGATVIIISTVVGGVSAGLIYLAAYSVLKVIQKKGYPLFPHRKREPIELESWLTDENKEDFSKKIAKWFKDNWFKDWLTLHHLTEEKATDFLWKKMKKGVFAGEVDTLIDQIGKTPDKPIANLLNKLPAKKVLTRQALAIIHADLYHFKQTSAKDLEAILRKPLFERNFFLNELETFDKFNQTLSDSFTFEQTKRYVGCLHLQTKSQTHTLFVQFTPEFVLYDGLGKKFNGYHDQFSNYLEGMTALHAHLMGYHSKWRPKAPKFNLITLKIYDIESRLKPPATVPNPPQEQGNNKLIPLE